MPFSFFKQRKNVLVLSSGAARGLAHLGALRFFLESGVEFDAVIGSSIGAIVGAYFALYREIEGLIDFALDIDWKKLLQALDVNIVNVAKGGVVSGSKSAELLKRVFGNSDFAELKIPFACVATDISDGRPVVINEGNILDALRASYSIPGIFVPVNRDGRFLIDGGVSSPVPVEQAMSLWGEGLSFWVVNVLSSPPRMEQKSNAVWNVISNIYGGHNSFSPSILDVLTQSVFIMESSIASAQSSRAQIFVDPDTSSVHFMDFTKAKELISIGYKTAFRRVQSAKKQKTP